MATGARRSDPARSMGESQRAYESRRAAKAGMSLDRWLDQKERAQAAAAAAAAPRPSAGAPAKKPGLISRLLDRAHKPLS